MYDHPFAIDVSDAEVEHFTGVQACAVGHAQGGLILQAAYCLQETSHFLETQDDRYLARLLNMAHLCGHLGALKGGPEEKLQCRDPGVEIAAGDALFNQVQLITPEIFGSVGIRRTFNMQIIKNTLPSQEF